jgi:ATP-dependent DNA helicase RecQ
MKEQLITPNLREILRQQFGFDAFRPGQEEAIGLLLEEKRLLCIQPTGYGKSLIYQLPSVLFEGITLVISPLLALMRDQIQQLNNRFDVPAASINSDQSLAENDAAMKAAKMKRIRILFIAPEKLDNLEIYAFLTQLDVSLIVVDEAHCISTWGHDFRPSYRQIVKAIGSFSAKNTSLHVLGLTATANERTERDIAAQLGESEGLPVKVLRMSMDRPNIRLSVVPVAGQAEKLARLSRLLKELPGHGILYCATREQTEIVAEFLGDQGLDVVAYHAGFDPDSKRELQKAFMAGKHKAIAATNALGMGIDKEDIRFIIHVDVPGSITAYYQEVGRCGRDGLLAEGILLFDMHDRRIQDHFIRSAQPTTSDFMKTLEQIYPSSEGMWPNLATVKIRAGLHPTKVTVILAELMDQGFIEKRLMARKQVYVRLEKKSAPVLTRYERQYAVRSTELEGMLRYADGKVGCLMQALRQALGDTDAPKCGRCSRCRTNSYLVALPADGQAEAWLSQRDVTIAPARRPPMSAGLAALNGDRRDALFVQFMRQRAKPSDKSELSPALIERIKQNMAKLQERHRFAAVLVIPSRTWQQREWMAAAIADILGIKSYADMLAWKEMPLARQGELLNNDQRRENVAGKMQLTKPLIRPGAAPPQKGILLLDDYVGSGSTLKEAGRVLRQEGGFTAEIVPFTIARVRWRLGARGMI